MRQIPRPSGAISRRSLFAASAGVAATVLIPKVVGAAEDSGKFAVAPISWSVDDYPEIEAMVDRIGRVLAFNATSFEGRLGTVYGINAGRLYPHVFARDVATFSEFMNYLFDPAFLRTPVEEFLWTQEEFNGDETSRGAVAATLSPAGELDKATAVSDEETSVINAAFDHFRAGAGTDWLATAIGSKSVLSRLNDSIEYLLRSRRDGATGLIYRAHTSDWGDVKLEGGTSPTDLLPGDAITVSIFDQSLAFRALGQLAEMNLAAGDSESAERYSTFRQQFRDAANAHLWDAARGRYVIHKHLSPLTHPFDESSIVSFGSAVAVHTGLASEEQARSIMANLDAAARAAGTNRAGLSLWPPYPAGTFNHPNMQPAVYQNGGVWDWWAGVQILAEFESGASERAFAHLVESARHWRNSNSVPEWFHLPTGTNQGSPEFAGAAGTLGLAVVRGLFGIRIDAKSYTVTSRLGSMSGRINVQSQHSEISVGFSQRAGDGWIAADIDTQASEGGIVSIAVPSDWPDAMVLIDDGFATLGLNRVMDDLVTEPVQVAEGVHTIAALRARAGSPDSALNSAYGRFFPVNGGSGYWITNASGIPLWDGYTGLGGLDLLGPPLSGRFLMDGLVSQAVHGAVLQWEPMAGKVVPASVFNALSQAGQDSWLSAIHRIPKAGPPDLGILDRDPLIKAVFLQDGDWQIQFGLPVSYADYADVSIVRAEKQAFQRWKVDTQWGARVGDVTRVNAGAIAVEAGIVPEEAKAPSEGLPPGG